MHQAPSPTQRPHPHREAHTVDASVSASRRQRQGRWVVGDQIPVVFPPAHQFRVLDRTGEVEYDSLDYGSLPKNPGVATVTVTLV